VFLHFFVNIEGLTEGAVLMGLGRGCNLPLLSHQNGRKDVISIAAEVYISV
jgi:hypothetical protein